jgi:hypothetical protein
MEGKEQLHLLRVIFLLFSLFKPLALALRLVMDGMNHNGSPFAVPAHHHPNSPRSVIHRLGW